MNLKQLHDPLRANNLFYASLFATPFEKQQNPAKTANDLIAIANRLAQIESELGYKYSPTQPRIPAGAPGGGQWTDGSGGGNNESQALQENHPTPDQVTDGTELQYPDGKPVINPNTGLPYPKPKELNIPSNIDFAKRYQQANSSLLARALIMVGLFRAGGSYDYQRPEGLIPSIINPDSFQTDYIDVTNYNYGVVTAAFGYSKEEALTAAGSYNRNFGNTFYEDITKYGIVQESVNNISQGHNDYYRIYRH